MLTKIEIENFKSIYKETIELGRVNVFIGENGCGKTNILEAVGMASANRGAKPTNDELALRGIRVTKPSITFSSFESLNGSNRKNIIRLKEYFEAMQNGFSVSSIEHSLTVNNPDDIFAEWVEPGTMVLEGGKLSWEGKEHYLSSYKIYHLSTDILRGIGGISHSRPGIHGENLDLLIDSLSKEELNQLLAHAHIIDWLDNLILDKEGKLKLEGHNLNFSSSKLYFRDKFMAKDNNIFSAENANEGILHILFYLALFISKRTPKFFAIDNIETALNPVLCWKLMVELVKLAKKNDKQVLITTHNPAVLDGLNLHDDEVRLFIVERDYDGHTRVERVKLKPNVELNGRQLKLSELWMRGHLGAIPQYF